MARDQFNLTGKVAVVAGASRGIGQEIAKILGEYGAHVVAVSRGADGCAETDRVSEHKPRTRRERVSQQADFFGSMDGASKFVKGDAIAALLITGINIIGGIVIGVMQKGLPLAAAANKYVMLTVGEGLVSQVPALIISVAAGLMVTNSAKVSWSS